MRWLAFVAGMWAVLGYLGWGWINYCAHLAGTGDADNERAKWHLFRHAPFWGPRLIVWHWRFLRMKGHMHFGLRFK